MRTLIAICVILLLSLTAYGETKPPAKLTRITGYGEYKLATPISDYDLAAFEGPFRDDVYSTDTWACYKYYLNTSLTIGGKTIDATLLLCTVNDMLEGVSLVAATEDQFSSSEEIDVFFRRLRSAILSKYSSMLVQYDAVPTGAPDSDGSYTLSLRDEHGNYLDFSTGGRVGLVLSYSTGLYKEISNAGIRRMLRDFSAEDDEGKL